MALTANTLPSVPPILAVPFDAALDLSNGSQTLTATGYMGAPNQVDWGQGRVAGIMALDITNLKVSAGNEQYGVYLLGSNDPAWGNGNVEILAKHDFGVRDIATIIGATPAIPPSGAAGTLVYIPFLNLMQRIVYRYLRGYVVIAGTAPTMTFRSWVAPLEMKI
jgi:hypothetical protein